MKKVHSYITLAAALTLAACTAEDNFTNRTSDGVVQVSALIATEVQSRVNTEGDGMAFSEGDVITLQNTSRTDKNVGNYKYENSTWTPTGDALVLWKGTEDNDFQAWYPATATYTSFTIPTDQSSTNLPTADWMTATGTAKRGDGSVSLAFNHLLSKVTVTINAYGTEYGEATPGVSDFKIHTIATEMTAAYDAGTTVTGTAAAATITPYQGAGSYTAIVAPGAYSGTFLTLNVKVGEDEAKAMTVTAPAGLTLDSGKAYAFTLKVGKDKAALGEVGVSDWNGEGNALGTDVQATEAVQMTVNGTTATLTPGASADNLAIEAYIADAIQRSGATEFVINGNLTREQIQGVTWGLSQAAAGSVTLTLSDVTVLDQNAFTNRSQLKEIHLPNVITLGQGALSDCSNLTTVSLPKATSIGRSAFYGCTSLTAIDLPEATTLGEMAFQRCEALTTVKIPKVTALPKDCFLYCTLLIGVTLSENLESIGFRCFAESGITTFEVPATVTTMGTRVFQSCASLQSIAVAAGNANYQAKDGVLYDKEVKTLIACPAGSTLESLTIPNTVTTIADGAFFRCKIPAITMPASVITLEGNYTGGLFDFSVAATIHYGGTKAQWETLIGDSGYYNSNTLTVHCSGGETITYSQG